MNEVDLYEIIIFTLLTKVFCLLTIQTPAAAIQHRNYVCATLAIIKAITIMEF